MNPWTEWTTTTTGNNLEASCYFHQDTPAETCRARSNIHADIAMSFGPSSDDSCVQANVESHAELADVYALLADALEAGEALARNLP